MGEALQHLYMSPSSLRTNTCHTSSRIFASYSFNSSASGRTLISEDNIHWIEYLTLTEIRPLLTDDVFVLNSARFRKQIAIAGAVDVRETHGELFGEERRSHDSPQQREPHAHLVATVPIHVHASHLTIGVHSDQKSAGPASCNATDIMRSSVT